MDKRENIIRLRHHVRIIWKSYATTSNLIEDTLEPQKASYLLRQDKNFHNPESSIYLYLVAPQNFLRSAEELISQLENNGLKNMKLNLDKTFNDIKTARDIIEHFEHYAIGRVILQKKKKVNLGDSHLSIKIDKHGQRIVQVFNIGEFNKSDLDWGIDGLMHFIERRIHEFLSPDELWGGFRPDKY